jgi:hypothetical protein
MKKSFSEQKLYKKNCEIKNHQYKTKFILNPSFNFNLHLINYF